MTVNHDVAGSNPAQGAKTKTGQKTCFLFYYSDFSASYRDLKNVKLSLSLHFNTHTLIYQKTSSITHYEFLIFDFLNNHHHKDN